MYEFRWTIHKRFLHLSLCFYRQRVDLQVTTRPTTCQLLLFVQQASSGRGAVTKGPFHSKTQRYEPASHPEADLILSIIMFVCLLAESTLKNSAVNIKTHKNAVSRRIYCLSEPLLHSAFDVLCLIRCIYILSNINLMYN